MAVFEDLAEEIRAKNLKLAIYDAGPIQHFAIVDDKLCFLPWEFRVHGRYKTALRFCRVKHVLSSHGYLHHLVSYPALHQLFITLRDNVSTVPPGVSQSRGGV